jgi:hypothetical protein
MQAIVQAMLFQKQLHLVIKKAIINYRMMTCLLRMIFLLQEIVVRERIPGSALNEDVSFLLSYNKMYWIEMITYEEVWKNKRPSSAS